MAGTIAFSSADYTVNESDGAAIITVNRTGAGTNVVSVAYHTQSGTAIAGQDYTPVNGALTFGLGQTNQTFSIPIRNDTLPEPDKTVLLTLSDPQGGAMLGQQTAAVLTIHDDDQGPFYRVDLTPPIGGTVTPGAGVYPAGVVKTFTATPDPGFVFSHWSGSTNTTANPLALVMNQDYQLTAQFHATVYTYTFEPPFSASDLTNSPWSSSGSALWKLQSATSSGDGRFALQSGPIRDGQQSTQDLVAVNVAGAASFDLRVSSEATWDFLEFYVNDTRLQQWSGNVQWQPYLFYLDAGTNRLSWRYVKDATFSAGLDTAFIDNVYVPQYVAPTVLQANWTASQGLSIEMRGAPGRTCVLEVSGDFSQWQPIATNVLTSDPVVFADSQAPVHDRRFYRAITR